MVHRIYVEKKAAYAVEAKSVLHEIRHLLRIKSVTGLRLLNRYDVEGISPELFAQCIQTVFSEPQIDDTFTELPAGDAVIATEYLPGQFDQRAASASECIGLISQGERPAVASARVYLLAGTPTADELAKIEAYLINPVEACRASLDAKDTLKANYAIPTTVETLADFTKLDAQGLADFVKNYGLAMDNDDIAFCQTYFKDENRAPTITEIRMIDTYWSDHCRHTTFGTILDEINIDSDVVKKAYERYLSLRETVHAGKNKPMCLMDLGTIG
ncbi:MAG: phosphoribosylformylglycinamidine synthase, partial [Ruthenibacterium sp.]